MLPQARTPRHAPPPERSAYDGVVPARGKALLKTDLAISVPPGTYGRVAPRSGLAWKNSIDVGAGVIGACGGGFARARQSRLHGVPNTALAPAAHCAPAPRRPCADEDYRGNVGVILFNHSDADFAVKAGDRVAQLVLERIAIAEIQEVAELDDTARGAGEPAAAGGVRAAAAATPPEWRRRVRPPSVRPTPLASGTNPPPRSPHNIHMQAASAPPAWPQQTHRRRPRARIRRRASNSVRHTCVISMSPTLAAP